MDWIRLKGMMGQSLLFHEDTVYPHLLLLSKPVIPFSHINRTKLFTDIRRDPGQLFTGNPSHFHQQAGCIDAVLPMDATLPL